MHRKVAAALVAALALAVASCGGSEKTTLGRAELVRHIELACRDAQREAQKAVRAAGRSRANPFVGIQAGQRFLADKLEDLETSGSAKADFDRFKEGVKTRLDAIDAVVSADRADRDRVMRSLEGRASAAARRIESSAKRLRVEGCG